MQDNILQAIFTPGTFLNMFNSATVVALAGLGCLLTDQAGMMNIGLDGIMLCGAFAGVIGSWLSGSWIVGVLCAICIGMLIGLFYGVMVIRWKSDEFIIGVALNLFAVALTTFLLRSIDGAQSAGTFHPTTGFIDTIPKIHFGVLGGTELNLYLMVPVTFVLVILCQFFIYRTPYGFWLHASGEHPDSLRSVGRSPEMMKYIGSIGCGFFCGLSGAYLSMGYSSTFSEGMTNSRGFIAVACVIFGRSNPLLVFLAALLFGFIDAVALRMQGFVDRTLTDTFPYLGTLLMMLVLALVQIRKRKRAA